MEEFALICQSGDIDALYKYLDDDNLPTEDMEKELLSIAINSGNTDICSILFWEYCFSIDKDDYELLDEPIKNNNVNMVEFLLSHLPRLNNISFGIAVSLMKTAIEAKNIEIVELMLNHGGYIFWDIGNDFGDTLREHIRERRIIEDRAKKMMESLLQEIDAKEDPKSRLIMKSYILSNIKELLRKE